MLGGGVYDAYKEEVQPGFLTILDPNDPAITPALDGKSTGRRTVLANWLADPKNPLSTRVIVNRVWHYHFGRGLVATPNDFAASGRCSLLYHASNAARLAGSATVARTTKKAAGIYDLRVDIRES